jgi:hypothetical protein
VLLVVGGHQLELNPVDFRDVEQGVTAFARIGGGGLIVAASGLAVAI